VTIKAWTDYPVKALGDWPGMDDDLRIRECEVVAYDGNKYCVVDVEGVRVVIKAGYLYTKPGLLGGPPTVSYESLHEIEIEWDEWCRLIEGAVE